MGKTNIAAACVLLFAIMAAGCLQEPVKLGCCAKENATAGQGCVLYNESAGTLTDFTSRTNPESDGQKCNVTAGYCNVTFDDDRQPYLVPICTEAGMFACLQPGCLAMVCGDFKFKPAIMPGLKMEDEQVSADPPAEDKEPAAVQFYKAQCRFLPMDSRLKAIMKSSKSAINVFRMGVGGSFDEFEQYRYFFPVSDKFCGVNPPTQAGETRVDRYMNYLSSSGAAYDPMSGITENCIDGSGDPAPVLFPETYARRTSSGPKGTFNYWPVTTDAYGYKSAHFGRIDYNSAWHGDWGEDYYRYDVTISDRQFSVYKEIDRDYYRKQLSIANVNAFYDTAGTGATRAGFECDSSFNECYSASCDTSFYNRGVLVQYPGMQEGGADIAADCNKITDEVGITRVVCAPTINVTPQGTSPPTINYAQIALKPVHYPVTGFPSAVSHDSLMEDLREEGAGFVEGSWGDNFDIYFKSPTYGITRTRTNVPPSVSFTKKKKKDCVDFPDSDSDTEVLCSSVGDTSSGPPAAGITFFGKLRNGSSIKYGGSTIIGYAVVHEDDFNNLMLVKNCGITSADYVKVDLGNSFRKSTLVDAFEPYMVDRVSAIAEKGFDDGCGGSIYLQELVLSSTPWVVSYKSGIITDPIIGDPVTTTIEYMLGSTSGQYLRERNIFSTAMQGMPGTSSCEMRQNLLPVMHFFASSVSSFYDVIYSRYIYLFKYTPESRKLGRWCTVDDVTYLPEVRTYGWCEPCTTSTLAYQNITARERVYMPAYSARIQESSYSNYDTICKPEYSSNWEPFDWFEKSDAVSCYNPEIADISDYQGSIGLIGAPRTTPEASVVKERLGDYMKSGVLPVLDLSHDSNWELANPDQGEDRWLIYEAPPDNYQEYDFKRLFGNMGATVVIVDHVSGTASADDVERIVERATAVRGGCWGCLTAIHVDTPTSNASFKQTLESVLMDPQASTTIDMVTFDYPMGRHDDIMTAAIGTPTVKGAGGAAIAQDIASYGRAALKTRGKPSMVVGFNLETESGWNKTTYDELLSGMIREQDELVKAGIIGMIYSPARTSGVSGTGSEGLVRVVSSLGNKGAKFCGFQQAMEAMAAKPPVSMFTRSVAEESPSCVPCSSLDLFYGTCDDTCDNGVSCALPGSGDGGDEEPAHVSGVVECVGLEDWEDCEAVPFSSICASPSSDYFRCDDVVDKTGCLFAICSTYQPGYCFAGVNEVGIYFGPCPPDESGGGGGGGSGAETGAVRYKCPDTVLAEPCKLCNQTHRTYTCTLSYLNGTVKTVSGNTHDLTSDLYLDIIGGIPKPYKCCLYDSSVNQTYTYTKDSYPQAVNKPLVFPKSGDAASDCGMTDASTVAELTSLCGMPVTPLKDYDINCTVSAFEIMEMETLEVGDIWIVGD